MPFVAPAPVALSDINPPNHLEGEKSRCLWVKHYSLLISIRYGAISRARPCAASFSCASVLNGMSTQPVRQEFAFTKARLCFTRNSESKSWAKIAAACPKLGYRRLNRVCERGFMPPAFSGPLGGGVKATGRLDLDTRMAN